MLITDQDRIAAEARMQDDLRGQPRVMAARYDRPTSRIVITLDSGLEIAFPPRLAEGLANATAALLAEIEITPLGDGLHWPTLNVDLSVVGLLAGVFGSRRWMAGLLGASGGRECSEAKTVSSR